MYQTMLVPSLTILYNLHYSVDFQCVQAYRKMAGAGLVLPSLPAKYRNGRHFPAGIPDDGDYLFLISLGRLGSWVSYLATYISYLPGYI